MNYNYLYVLDFNLGEINEIKLDEIDKQKMDNDELDVADLLKEYGLHIAMCNYMFTENKIEVETIKKL